MLRSKRLKKYNQPLIFQNITLDGSTANMSAILARDNYSSCDISRVRFTSEGAFMVFMNSLEEADFKSLQFHDLSVGRNNTSVFNDNDCFFIFCRAIANMPLTKLKLGKFTISDIQIQWLLQYLISHNDIKEFAIENSDISDTALALFAGNQVQNIKSLCLKDANISDQGVTYVAAFIANTELKCLNLASNQFSAIGLNRLLQALPSTVEELNLSGARFDNIAFNALLDWIKKAEPKKIILADCGLNDAKIKELADAIIHKKVNILNLDKNDITDAGLKYLAIALFFNNTLRELCIMGNELVTRHGVINIIPILKLRAIKLSTISLPNFPDEITATLPLEDIDEEVGMEEVIISKEKLATYNNPALESHLTRDEQYPESIRKDMLVLFALVGARDTERISKNSPTRHLPTDLYRKLSQFLYPK